jgi:hypothetical protein
MNAEIALSEELTWPGTFADIANVIDTYPRKESDFITRPRPFLGGL